MTTFKLPPSDERYLNTPFEMMEMLFINFLNTSNYDDMGREYRRSKTAAKKYNREDYFKQVDVLDDILSELGYEDGDMSSIKETLKESFDDAIRTDRNANGPSIRASASNIKRT